MGDQPTALAATGGSQGTLPTALAVTGGQLTALAASGGSQGILSTGLAASRGSSRLKLAQAVKSKSASEINISHLKEAIYRLAILYTIFSLNNVSVYRDGDKMKTPFSVVEIRPANMSGGRPAVKALCFLSTFLVLLHTIECDIRVLSFRKSDIA